MSQKSLRPGEIVVPGDPAGAADDARLVFIGRIRSPWKTRAGCPKNLPLAREAGAGASLEIDAPWRAGLSGLASASHIVLVYWMDEARRDVIVQWPRHSESPRGVFALRSPVRPNPIALATVRLLSVDEAQGILTIDAIDARDGTPLLDMKPWYPTLDTGN